MFVAFCVNIIFNRWYFFLSIVDFDICFTMVEILSSKMKYTSVPTDVTRIDVIRIVPVWMAKALHFLSIYSSLLSKETVEPRQLVCYRF